LPFPAADNFINQDQLDQLKADILSKINSRFQANEALSLRSKYEQEHLIQRERFENIHLDKMSAARQSDDEQMDDFSELPCEKKSAKRQRLYSGCIQKSNS
jgi:hypothetical protein